MTWPQLFCKLFPELIFLTPEKNTAFFPPVWNSFSFYTAAPAVTKLPSVTKESKDGLGSVIQSGLTVPWQITHFQILGTNISSFPIRRRSNTDYSSAKCKTFWVERLSSIITKYFKDILALIVWDFCMSVILKSLVIIQLSSPEITGGCMRSPSPCSSAVPGGLQQWSVVSFCAISQHACPQAATVVCFYTDRWYLAISAKTCLLIVASFEINRL